MPDPSSPSTSSARDAWKAVDDAWQRANDAHRHSFGNNRCTCGWTGSGFAQHRSDMRRDAALGLTYTLACETCRGFGIVSVPRAPGADTAVMVNCACLRTDHPRRSAPRLALIDVLVASGALEVAHPDVTVDLADGPPVHLPATYRIPSSKES